MTAVKICGVGRRRDVEAAAGAGADYVGLVFADSPRRVTAERALELSEEARRRGLDPVGVFVDRGAAEVEDRAGEAGLRVVQLHGRETPETCRLLRETGRVVWKAVRPRSREALWAAADRYRDVADALLVEGHSPRRAGGTGSAFPHEWLEGPDGRRLDARLVLAGGLDADNVAAAVRRVRPAVVDVSSGVESAPGEKSPDAIRAFVAAVRAGATDGAGSRG